MSDERARRIAEIKTTTEASNYWWRQEAHFLLAELERAEAERAAAIGGMMASQADAAEAQARAETAEAALKEARAALRGHVISRWFGLGDVQPSGGLCIQCEEEWPEPGPEKHKPGCLAQQEGNGNG